MQHPYHRANPDIWLSNKTKHGALLDLIDNWPNYISEICEYTRNAMKQGYVSVQYSPIVRIASGKIACEEAVIAWNDQEYGNVPIRLIMPALQEAGLSHELTLFVLDRVLEDIDECSRQGVRPVPVAIPVSTWDFEQIDLLGELTKRLRRHNTSRELIRIQLSGLTNSTILHNIVTKVDELRDAGFLVCLDSFDESYSTIDLLRNLNFDALKIDVGFLRSDDDEKSRLLLEGILQTSKRLHHQTIADGVNTPAQSRILEEMGCRYLQGNLFGCPLNIRETIAISLLSGKLDREPRHEESYWNKISSISLHGVQWNIDKQMYDEAPVYVFPVAVIEKRGPTWRLLRSIGIYKSFLTDANLIANEQERLLEPTYFDSLFSSDVSNTWRHIAGHLEHGSKYQFYVRQIAKTTGAVAYVVGAIPTMLGTALGSYGDVPVAYAVIRAIFNEDRSDILDAEYVYVNNLHSEWIHLRTRNILGRRLSSIYKNAQSKWFPSLRKAVILSKEVHSVFYSDEIGHWLSFNIAPSLVEDHYIYAITYADDEQREHEAMEQQARELESISMHDSLTGVLNRRGIDTLIDKRLAKGDVDRYALVLMDIDDFKTINDVHGHEVGDEALRVISRTLTSLVPETAILGRNGGDEFLVMLVNDDVDLVVETLDRLISTKLSFELHGVSHKVTMSIGYVIYPDQVRDLKSAYTKADAALYAVKLSGKSSYGRYRPQLEKQYRSQLGFTPRDIAENVPGSILVHEPGPDGKILFANDELVGLFECDDLSDFMKYTGGVFSGVIDPADHESVRQTLEKQITLDDVGGKNFVNFRIVTKTGKVKNVANNGRLVEIADTGKVFYELLIDLDVRSAYV